MIYAVAIIAAVLASISSAFGGLFLKKGAVRLKFHGFSTKSLLSILKNHNIFIGLFLYLLTTALCIFALTLANLSIVYPIMASLSYVWAVFLSIKFLREKMNIYKLAGIACIIAGVVLIAV